MATKVAAGGDGIPDVNAEDQKNINTFGRLASLSKELTAEIAALKREIESVENAVDDAMLADEVRVMMGETYVVVPYDEAEEMMKDLTESLRGDLAKKTQALEQVQERTVRLKAILKNRFKDTINLEEN
mmetsp:Transcript_12023/g.26970  ORF Transcript_12023/g.26970 Transcript_12023/m.26970 type:complete len:129 (+) Transcript_12023:22-408(+)